MNWAKFKLWWEFYWVHLVLVLIVLAAVLLPLWYLTRLEESVARYIIGFNVISLPSSIINLAASGLAIIFSHEAAAASS